MSKIAEIADALTDIQREAILRAKKFSRSVSLTDWMEDSWDITEGLSEKIADPVCGTLTPLGLQIKAHLEGRAALAAIRSGVE